MTTPKEAVEQLADSFDVDVDEDATGGRPSQATQIVGMALTAVSLWHSDEGDPFATIEVNGHHENWPLRSRAFRNFLDYNFYRTEGTVPNSQARQGAIDTLSGMALYDSPEAKVWTRIAEHSGSIVLDLGNTDWSAVIIGPDSWIVTENPPVKFRRPKSMQPLPFPLHNGSVDDLRRFLNLGSDADWTLIQAWLVQSVFATGPYPVLTLYGEAGSAKSTAARVLKSCVDPAIAPLRSKPRNEHDLVIAARNGWVIALDNLSSLPIWLSDALCRLATGGGLGTKKLYSDSDESLFDVQRPIILNGISALAERGDLLDRCIPITLPVIGEDARRVEGDFWKDFDEAHPAILGGLLDTVSGALREVPNIELDRLPRMADFAMRAVAAETAQGWRPGTFVSAYSNNRAGANDAALESSPVATAVVNFMTPLDVWTGTATELLSKLKGLVDEATARRRGWPVDGARLSAALRRTAPNLRSSGIDVQLDTPSRRKVTIRKMRDFSVITDMQPDDGPMNSDDDAADADDAKMRNFSIEEVIEF